MRNRKSVAHASRCRNRSNKTSEGESQKDKKGRSIAEALEYYKQLPKESEGGE